MNHEKALEQLRPIADVARGLGVEASHVLPYGTDKAKIRLDAKRAAEDRGRSPGRLVLVSAVTPTNAGEGKTTTSIGLAQGLAHIGESVCLALREPSLGPTFGRKGGATGGGKSIVVPTADINLHFTGDFHAITSANNLLAAMLDNHLHFRKEPTLESREVLWRRVLDLNDRALRQTVVGLGGRFQGMPRETGFDITPASEVMAILCLAEDQEDLRQRLGRILIGFTPDGDPVTADDVGAVGAMMVLLRDALMPNLVQSIEGVPAFIHGGPFANIAHGCNSVVATKMAMAHADWTITEAGFGFDLGAEKFFDIKCRSADLNTVAVVLVATVRALKRHGGVAGGDFDSPDAAAVEAGLGNLHKHIENARALGQRVVVALNRFHTDSDEEIDVVRRACGEVDAAFAVSDHFARGGEGAADLARALVENAADSAGPLQPLYELSSPIRDKIEAVATRMYGAGSVHYTKRAEKDLARIEGLGHGDLPVCMAKAPTSLTDDPTVVGRPEGFPVTVRGFELAAGAGFVIPLLGDVMRMPGLPREPQAQRMDLVDGEIEGLLGA